MLRTPDFFTKEKRKRSGVPGDTLAKASLFYSDRIWDSSFLLLRSGLRKNRVFYFVLFCGSTLIRDDNFFLNGQNTNQKVLAVDLCYIGNYFRKHFSRTELQFKEVCRTSLFFVLSGIPSGRRRYTAGL